MFSPIYYSMVLTLLSRHPVVGGGICLPLLPLKISRNAQNRTGSVLGSVYFTFFYGGGSVGSVGSVLRKIYPLRVRTHGHVRVRAHIRTGGIVLRAQNWQNCRTA